MKKHFLIAVICLVAGLVIWQLYSRLSPKNFASASPLPSPTPGLTISTNQTPPTNDKVMGADDVRADAKTAREALELEQQLTREYNTSIVFYGLVLDQNDKAVSQAEVQYMNADSATGNWTWKKNITREDGAFTLSGIRGRYLDIKIRHPGYYVLSESQRSFTYAGNNRGPDFRPDPARPEIFRLRKKGEAAELVRQYDRILFTKEDGHARSFSLYDHSRRRDQPDYVILQGVDTAELDRQGKPIRRLEMVVPKGGIQQRTDPLAFVAPSEGYQPSMYYMRPEFGGQLDYFVKFDNGNYGRFTIMGTGGDYLIESYLNPDQSPNLEYDKDKEITFVRTGRMGIDLLYPASDDPNKPLPKSTPSKPVERPGGTLIERRRNAAPPPAPPRG